MIEVRHEDVFTTQVAEGYVLLEGPRVAVTLNPHDALLIAEQLIAAATRATANARIFSTD